MEIMRNSESRYLNSQEQREILEYTESLPRRFKAAAAVEQKEEAIVQTVIEQVKRRYTSFERFHPKAWDKAARDMQLTLRYTVQAMICDDPDFQCDRLLYWLGTIFHSFGFSPQFNRDTYTFLRDTVKTQVPAEAYSLLEPFLEKNIEVLGSMPEPAQVLV
jgi:hypothetical protein